MEFRTDLDVRTYETSSSFRMITHHTAVTHEDGALVAVVGPAQDTESEAYAALFAASPHLFAAAKFALSVIQAQGMYDLSERMAAAQLEHAIALVPALGVDRRASAIVEADAYRLLRDAIIETLDPADDDVAEVAIMIGAIEQVKRVRDEIVRALNTALAELREISETLHLNGFDEVVAQLPDQVKQLVTVDLSPIFDA